MSAPLRPGPNSLWLRALLLASLAALAAIALALHRPPQPRPLSTPDTEFSAARAMVHLHQIASTSHPTGSDEHRRVREYILENLRAQGLSPEVQTVARAMSRWRRPIPGGFINNMIVMLPGERPGGPALMLACHYDSVAMGPGAGDDGAAVAAMLETIRALRAQNPLENDIIFLFTDAEELGLVGADVFMELHPLAARAAVVLNFEARGSGGPVHMFETSDQNGWLIRELSASGAPIIAASLASAVYKRMPNDTDLTVFLRHKKQGLGFAFIGGLRNYHTENDDIAHLDPGSMEHHGELMLALARRLGNADLGHPQETDAVYFNVIGTLFVHYPSPWSPVFLLLGVAAFAVALFLGFSRRHITLPGLMRGLSAFITELLASFLIGLLGWLLIQRADKRFLPSAVPRIYDDAFYGIALCLLAWGASWAIAAHFTRKEGTTNVFTGHLVGFFALAAATTAGLPAASFLFTWPLLFGALGLCARLAMGRVIIKSYKDTIIITLSMLPLLLLYAPVVHDLIVALALFGSAASLLVFALMAGLPAAFFFGPPKREDPYVSRIPAVLAAAGALLFVFRWISA